MGMIKKFRFRSSITGRYVTRYYALGHPDTTYMVPATPRCKKKPQKIVIPDGE